MTYQIRTPLMGFIPPYFGSGLFISVVFGVTGFQSWSLVVFIAGLIIALIIESRSQRRLIERKMIPRLNELETLREKLTDPQR